jgi:hypothetical protein
MPTRPYILERAIYAFNIARRHRLYGWNDIASDQYNWLKHWLCPRGSVSAEVGNVKNNWPELMERVAAGLLLSASTKTAPLCTSPNKH